MPGSVSPPPPDRFARLIWAAVLVTIAITPLIFSTVTKDVYRLPKTLFFQGAALIIGAAVVAWDAVREELGRRAAPHRLSLILAALAVAWTAVVSMAAQNPIVSAHAPFTVFCYAAFFGAALLFARPSSGLVLFALLAPATVNAIVLVLQWRGIWTPVARSSATTGRMAHTALQGNPDPAGMVLLIPAIAAIASAMTFRRWRPLLIAASALLLVGLLLTESITVFVTLGAVFAAFIVVMPSWKARITMIALAIAGVAVLALYQPTRMRLVKVVRSASAGDLQEATSNRLPSWNVAWTMFGERPVTGVGPGGFAARYMSYKLAGDERHPEWLKFGNFNFGEAHNDHLQLLAEAGLPGYALFMIISGRVALLSLRLRRRGDERARFVSVFAFPAAVGFGVAMLAQFPMHLTAPSAVAVFAAALCHAWGTDASS